MDVAQSSRLAGQAAAEHGPPPGSRTNIAARDAQLDPKLVSAAHQFEASLMQELLKPLSSDQIFGDDGEEGNAGVESGLGNMTSSADGSGGALMSFGSESLAGALSERGGLGIARRVLDHFEAATAAVAKRPAGMETSLPQFKVD